MSPEEQVPPGTWARVHEILLSPGERAPAVPPDTAKVAFEVWVHGWLVEPASMGAPAKVRTRTGRIVEARLVEVNPGYQHSFGRPPEPLERAGERARSLILDQRES